MIYALDMVNWKYVIYNIPLDNFNHHTAKVVFTDDEDDARCTFSEMNEKGVDRFILMALVSPKVAGLIEQQHDIEDIVAIIKANHTQHKVLLCNKDRDSILEL